jgi:hypothetical protein
MSLKITQLIEQLATLSPQERLELATHLKSSQNSPDRWDLSEAAIAKRNIEMRQVLAEWRETCDETEQRSLVLETITNLRSQQPSFKTPKEIDAEILEEKASWIN